MATHTLDQLKADIGKLMKQLADPEPLLGELGQRLIQSFKYGFRESKSPDNEPWEPITHREGKPLIDTGRLRRSLGFKLTNNNETLLVGTNVVYARIHNEGMDDKVKVKAHKKKITMAFGKPIPPKVIQVKAHTTTKRMTKREFMGFGARQKHPFKKALDFWAGKAIKDMTDD